MRIWYFWYQCGRVIYCYLSTSIATIIKQHRIPLTRFSCLVEYGCAVDSKVIAETGHAQTMNRSTVFRLVPDDELAGDHVIDIAVFVILLAQGKVVGINDVIPTSSNKLSSFISQDVVHGWRCPKEVSLW